MQPERQCKACQLRWRALLQAGFPTFLANERSPAKREKANCRWRRCDAKGLLTGNPVGKPSQRCGSAKRSPASAGIRSDAAIVAFEHEVRVVTKRVATKSPGGEVGLRVGCGGGACKERDRWSDRQERSLGAVLA